MQKYFKFSITYSLRSKALLPASSYCYEVEQYDEENPTSTGQIGTAPFDRLRRRKGVYTRDKNRLFLKQFVENGGEGVIVIKVEYNKCIMY